MFPFLIDEKFVNYFHEYLKREANSIQIEIVQSRSDDGPPSVRYTIQIKGTKQDIRSVRHSIRNLFQTIESKKYQNIRSESFTS